MQYLGNNFEIFYILYGEADHKVLINKWRRLTKYFLVNGPLTKYIYFLSKNLFIHCHLELHTHRNTILLTPTQLAKFVTCTGSNISNQPRPQPFPCCPLWLGNDLRSMSAN